jgi:hypothetical protein
MLTIKVAGHDFTVRPLDPEQVPAYIALRLKRYLPALWYVEAERRDKILHKMNRVVANRSIQNVTGQRKYNQSSDLSFLSTIKTLFNSVPVTEAAATRRGPTRSTTTGTR